MDVPIERRDHPFYRSPHFWMIAFGVLAASLVGILAWMFAFAFPHQAIYGQDPGEYQVPQTGDGSTVTLRALRPPVDGSLKLNVNAAKIVDLNWEFDTGSPDKAYGLLITADAGVYHFIQRMVITADCPTFTITEAIIGTADIQFNRNDGKSFLHQPTTTADNIVIASTRGYSQIVDNTGASFDTVHLLGGANGATIRNFNLTVRSSRPCQIGRLKVGELIMHNGRIGEGDGLDDKDFIITASVQILNPVIKNNLEVRTDVR